VLRGLGPKKNAKADGVMSSPKHRAEKFLEYLDSLSGGVEPTFYPLDSLIAGAPPITCIVYDDLPEPGMLTGITFGLSEAEHPDWKISRPELTITVRSRDHRWALAVAEMANQLRGKCPFIYGNVIDFGCQISQESDMSAFFVFAPGSLDRAAYLDIEAHAPWKLSLAGMYPIYDSERAKIHDWGLDKFWHHPNFDMYNVKRAKVE
jgi:hypothetical protein